MFSEQQKFNNEPTTQELKEKNPTPREKLLALEKEGIFVFHGSPVGGIEALEPRQAVIGRNQKKHGEPCVAATGFAEIAIFRAIINYENFPEGCASTFGLKHGLPYFETTEAIRENLTGKTGYVYVFNKSDFEQFGKSNFESRCNKKIKPIEIIEVTSNDLPKNIVRVEKISNKLAKNINYNC